MSIRVKEIISSIHDNDFKKFNSCIILTQGMHKNITKECIKYKRWDMLKEWSYFHIRCNRYSNEQRRKC